MIKDLTISVENTMIDEYLSKQENKILAQGHIGTHLDIYNKSKIPLEYFKRRGIILDAYDIAERKEIGLEVLGDGEIKPGDFVLIRTGRIERYSYGTREYFLNHPVLSLELIDYLIDKRISFIGIDCPGIRSNGIEHQNADKYCEENGVYVVENIINLDELLDRKFTVYTMWIDDVNATGLRCRLLAEIL